MRGQQGIEGSPLDLSSHPHPVPFSTAGGQDVPSRVILPIAVLLALLTLIACRPLQEQQGLDGEPPSAVAQPGPGEPTGQAAPPTAQLVLPAEPVRQDGQLPVQGAGFAPDEPVIIVARSSDQQDGEIGRLRADSDGRLGQQKLTLPSWLTSGEYQIEATGEESGRQARATLLVRAKGLWAQVDNHAYKPTERLGFIAGGFVPGERVQVYLGRDESGSQPLAIIGTDRVGNTAWTEVVVPMLEAGQYTLRLVGSEGEVRETILIEPFRPAVELSPWSGPPGSTTELNAKGFAPGEPVLVYLEGDAHPALVVQADQWGNIWGAGPLAIPADRKGSSIGITASGQQSGATVRLEFYLHEVRPWVQLTSYAGMAGTPVSLSGGGFAAGERVTVHIDERESPPVASGTTDGQGNFSAIGPVRIHGEPEEQVTFVVVGDQSGAETRATFKVLASQVPERSGL